MKMKIIVMLIIGLLIAILPFLPELVDVDVDGEIIGKNESGFLKPRAFIINNTDGNVIRVQYIDDKTYYTSNIGDHYKETVPLTNISGWEIMRLFQALAPLIFIITILLAYNQHRYTVS